MHNTAPNAPYFQSGVLENANLPRPVEARHSDQT